MSPLSFRRLVQQALIKSLMTDSSKKSKRNNLSKLNAWKEADTVAHVRGICLDISATLSLSVGSRCPCGIKVPAINYQEEERKKYKKAQSLSLIRASLELKDFLSFFCPLTYCSQVVPLRPLAFCNAGQHKSSLHFRDNSFRPKKKGKNKKGKALFPNFFPFTSFFSLFSP